jgi:hypothetical protein
MLIFVAGPVSGPGDSLAIERVENSAGSLKVMVAIFHQCRPLPMSTMPYDIVQIHRSAKSPIFENRYVPGPYCRPVDSNLAKTIHREPQK